jgi:hypothetical protein
MTPKPTDMRMAAATAYLPEDYAPDSRSEGWTEKMPNFGWLLLWG